MYFERCIERLGGGDGVERKADVLYYTMYILTSFLRKYLFFSQHPHNEITCGVVENRLFVISFPLPFLTSNPRAGFVDTTRAYKTFSEKLTFNNTHSSFGWGRVAASAEQFLFEFSHSLSLSWSSEKLQLYLFSAIRTATRHRRGMSFQTSYAARRRKSKTILHHRRVRILREMYWLGYLSKTKLVVQYKYRMIMNRFT